MSQAYSRRPVWGRPPDQLVVEEPLEIRINGQPVAVTMRTPGYELDLVLGFLYTEGIIAAQSDVVTAKLCTDTPNVAEVRLASHVAAPAGRNFYTTSSCGVCGKASIEAVRVTARFDTAADPVTIPSSVLTALPERLRQAQRGFARTGGSHAAGVFTASGQPVAAREDVGRHNALDKAVGALWQRDALPLAGHIVLMSGRASFELVQKAWLAGIPIVAAVSAPSTAAVDLASEAGITLIGFLRGETMNVYTRPDRITCAPP